MSKTTIYYFSATGNSYAVARDLAHILDVGDPVSIPGSLVNEDPYIDSRDAKVVGFVFPVQRATIPEMLRGFLQSFPVDPDCYYFAISTYSLFGSNEFWDIDEILTQNGAELNFAAGVRMMGNVGIRQPSPATIERRHELMEKTIDEIATAVAYLQENYFPRSNKLLGKAVRIFTDLRRRNIVFHIDKHCKKCGICAQVCPAQNIDFPSKDSQVVAPMRSDKCEACLACVHWCPASAISTSRRRHVSYHNPTVSPDELHPKLQGNGASGTATLSTAEGSEREDEELSVEGTRRNGNRKRSDRAKLDAELAEALRNNLVKPKDVDQWISENEEPLPAATGYQKTDYIGTPRQTISNDEIAEALSELES